MENKKLINSKWLIISLSFLLLGYLMMTFGRAEILELSLSTIFVLSGFSLTAFSLFKKEA